MEESKMNMVEEIEKALQAHRLWRAQLKEAIQTHKTDKPIGTIRANNMCAFGKWLYGSDIPSEQKKSDHYKIVTELHTEFHKIAGEVAQLAITGKTAEAEALMSTSGKYLEISSKLSSELTRWKQAAVLIPAK
jgi:hypothetical protein